MMEMRSFLTERLNFPSLLQRMLQLLSFLQRKRQPNWSNLFIPNILMSSHHLESSCMILLCSVPLSIFQPFPSKSLEIASVIILWMVLLYRIVYDGKDNSRIKETDINTFKRIFFYSNKKYQNLL